MSRVNKGQLSGQPTKQAGFDQFLLLLAAALGRRAAPLTTAVSVPAIVPSLNYFSRTAVKEAWNDSDNNEDDVDDDEVGGDDGVSPTRRFTNSGHPVVGFAL